MTPCTCSKILFREIPILSLHIIFPALPKFPTYPISYSLSDCEKLNNKNKTTTKKKHTKHYPKQISKLYNKTHEIQLVLTNDSWE